MKTVTNLQQHVLSLLPVCLWFQEIKDTSQLLHSLQRLNDIICCSLHVLSRGSSTRDIVQMKVPLKNE